MYAILRTAKLTTRQAVASSAQHTYRQRETLNANAKAANKVVGAASSGELLAALDRRLEGLDVRDDNVLCIEYLVAASPEAFKRHGGKLGDLGDGYFNDALAWIKKQHGAENVIGAAVHLDERTPHMAVYVVPRIEGQEKTRKRSVIVGTNEDGTKRRETRTVTEKQPARLSAAHWLDGRDKLTAMQTKFAQEVGAKYGLERGVERSGARHQKISRWYTLMQMEPPKMPPMPKLGLWDKLRPEKAIKKHMAAWRSAMAGSLAIATARAATLSDVQNGKKKAERVASDSLFKLSHVRAELGELEKHVRALGMSPERAKDLIQRQQTEIQTQAGTLLQSRKELRRVGAEMDDAEAELETLRAFHERVMQGEEPADVWHDLHDDDRHGPNGR